MITVSCFCLTWITKLNKSFRSCKARFYLILMYSSSHDFKYDELHSTVFFSTVEFIYLDKYRYFRKCVISNQLKVFAINVFILCEYQYFRLRYKWGLCCSGVFPQLWFVVVYRRFGQPISPIFKDSVNSYEPKLRKNPRYGRIQRSYYYKFTKKSAKSLLRYVHKTLKWNLYSEYNILQASY